MLKINKLPGHLRRFLMGEDSTVNVNKNTFDTTALNCYGTGSPLTNPEPHTAHHSVKLTLYGLCFFLFVLQYFEEIIVNY